MGRSPLVVVFSPLSSVGLGVGIGADLGAQSSRQLDLPALGHFDGKIRLAISFFKSYSSTGCLRIR
jgi:hypothetical protein